MFFQVPLNYFLNIGLLFEFIASRSTFSIKPPPLSIRYWHETILKLLFYFGFDRRVSRMTIDRTVQRFLWRTLQRRCLFFGSSAAPSVGVRLGPHCVGWPSKDRGGVAGSRASRSARSPATAMAPPPAPPPPLRGEGDQRLLAAHQESLDGENLSKVSISMKKPSTTR